MKLRLFYDVNTGEIFFENYMNVDRTIELDKETFNVLKERTDVSYDYLDVDYGAYSQDFRECSGYRVNVETKALEFSYPDPNEPTLEQPYQAPLSEKVKKLELAQSVTDTTLLELMESVLQ